MSNPTTRPWNSFRSFGGMRCFLIMLIPVSIVIVATIIIVCEKREASLKANEVITTPPPPRNRTKRQDPRAIYPTNRNDDPMGVKLTLVFTKGVTSTAIFDACSVFNCKDEQSAHQLTNVEKYMCLDPTPLQSGMCKEWGLVWWNTGIHGWTHTPSSTDALFELKTSISLVRQHADPPYLLPCGKRACNPIMLTIRNPRAIHSRTYILAADVTGYDPRGRLRITIKPAITNTNTQSLKSPNADDTRYLKKVTYQRQLELETGYAQENMWLRWLSYTANQVGKTDCIVCSQPRPLLTPGQFRLNPGTDPVRYQCVLNLFTDNQLPTNQICKSLHYQYPKIAKKTPLGVVVSPGSFICHQSLSGSYFVGSIDKRCRSVIMVPGGSPLLNMIQRRADLWWWCGDGTIYSILPKNWKGACALVQLIMPIQILPADANTLAKLLEETTHVQMPHSRSKRSISPKGSFDSSVYIDNIGVPRGVPNEFKARNQIGAGFESMFFWWVTINKNVDWINYIYYNQQRLVNYTRDAVGGLHEQLDATSLMAWQNRMALDMLLAERGGVCSMFGTACCTFIPNNTAPDGTVTKALAGLTALSKELTENSGISDPVSDWLEKMFGKWKNLIATMIISLSCVVLALVLCGCCCIPCIRGLAQRLIDTALTKKDLQAYQGQIDEADDDFHVHELTDNV